MIVLFDNANIVPGDSQDLFNLAVNTPGTKFVFAHMGATNFRFWTQFCSRDSKGFLQRQHLFRYIGDRHPGCGFANQIRVRMDDSHTSESIM